MIIRIQIASVPDRENLVAELWLENVEVAEVSREHDFFEVEVYANRTLIPLDQYMAALAEAKEKLQHHIVE